VLFQPADIAPHFNSCARMRQRERRPCVRHQSFIGVGASASFGLVDGGSSGAASFDPEAGTSSAAGTSLTSTGAMASVNAFAGSIGADPDAGATSGAATFNLAASPTSSGGRGRGHGGDETVRRCWAPGLRNPLRNFCQTPDDGACGAWIDGHSA
jgi:hypothetical protein